MKKSLLVVSCLLLVAGSAPAQVFIGSRQAGMGGAGTAASVGLNAVAYNPARMLKGPAGEFLLSLGGASQGIDQIVQSVSKISDPAQFMLDNYSTKLDANGTVSGIFGFNFSHLGFSVVLPGINVTLNKAADTLAGSAEAIGTGAVALTLGQSFSIPGLPIGAIDVGANVKALYAASGSLNISSNPTSTTPVTSTQESWVGSGLGYDLGANLSVEIPYLTDFSVGIALRNLSQSIKYKPKSRTDTYTVTPPSTTPTLTKGTEIEGAEKEATYPTTTSVGCSGTVPGVGLRIAADLNSTSGGSGVMAAAADTVTHIGLEYPMMFNALILRAGMASGQNISRSTMGAKINIPFITLEITNVIDNKNSKNTSYVVDAGIAF